MMKLLLCTSAAVLLSACAAPHQPAYRPKPYKYWGKEGVSQQAAADQLGYCRHEVRASDLSKEHASKLVSYCMHAKGYTLMTGYR